MSGLVDKIKHAVHPTGTKTVDEVDNDKHKKTHSHEVEEDRADTLARERNLDEVAHPSQHGTPMSLPAQNQGENLSSFAPRETLDAAAHHQHESRHHPDMQGVTHIPESEIPYRHARKENTALRPSDPNNPASMDGAANYAVAGDDRAI